MKATKVQVSRCHTEQCKKMCLRCTCPACGRVSFFWVRWQSRYKTMTGRCSGTPSKDACGAEYSFVVPDPRDRSTEVV